MYLADSPVEFRDLWGRPLQLIGCQNLFCEVDKYARVATRSQPNDRCRMAAPLSVVFYR